MSLFSEQKPTRCFQISFDSSETASPISLKSVFTIQYQDLLSVYQVSRYINARTDWHQNFWKLSRAQAYRHLMGNLVDSWRLRT